MYDLYFKTRASEMAQVKTLAAKPGDLEHTSVKCYAPKQGLEKYLIRRKHGNLEKLDLSFKERGTNSLALITVYCVHTGGRMCITACVWRSEGDLSARGPLLPPVSEVELLSFLRLCPMCLLQLSIGWITDLSHHIKYFYMAFRGGLWGKHSYPVGLAVQEALF